MKIAIPQINYHIGDISKNRDLIIAAIKKAKAMKAELVLFPEHAICGAYPQDLFEKEYFVNECRVNIEKIAEQCHNIAALVGGPNLDLEDGILMNAMFFMYDGEVRGGVNKTILSDYDVFDESRYFIPGESNTPLHYKNQNIRVIFDEYESNTIEKTDSFIVHVGSTPFTTESFAYRKESLSYIAHKQKCPLISLNHVGANASLIFDGNSFVVNSKGITTYKLAAFKEDFMIIDTERLLNAPALKEKGPDNIALIHDALILGIKDFFHKNGFSKAVLGLSGGIDSALVAALATEALGKENVLGILMPSRFSTDHSVTDAVDLAKNLGISHEILPIKEIYDNFITTLKPVFKDAPFNVAEENLQARIRGSLVMAISNKFGNILLNTSNKSEAAVGYGTLYGDLCGSLSVLGDVYKTDVYKLSRYMNRNGELIPENTITKAPSAELRPGQKDQDSLPDYDTLDAILKLYLEENSSKQEIIAKGFAPEIVEKTLSLVNRNDYKRAQCPPILKVSKKAFGSGRRMPLVAKL
ncbi:NAD+ synthase [Butyricimonas virosa]|uniref:Glutamine-dependent NAD(+) synthetase n=1 Tax=Butyricimonas virosa TaxID=544645 RepID=A0A415QQ85_9BACT|nr:NAD+ synthase [Butyricimonas virosa]RHM46857.1 NAD+ synthase [Butyricimonas virosa]